jgi:hypothetical protein
MDIKKTDFGLKQRYIHVALLAAAFFLFFTILAKYLLLKGETAFPEKIFRWTLNRKGQAIALAAAGKEREALKLAGGSSYTKGLVSFSCQNYIEALRNFESAEKTAETFYPLLALGQIKKAESISKNISRFDESDLLLYLTSANIPEIISTMDEHHNSFGLASIFFKLHEFPTAFFYLKMDDSALSQSYLNALSNNMLPMPLPEKSPIRAKLETLRLLLTGHLEKSLDRAKGSSFDTGLLYYYILTGEWDSYFSLTELMQSQGVKARVLTPEEIYSPIPKNKSMIDEIQKKHRSVLVQPYFAANIYTSENKYVLLSKLFFIAILIGLLVLVYILAKQYVAYRKKKQSLKISAIDSVQQYPSLKKDSESAPHSWDISDNNEILSNEYLIMKTALETIGVPFAENNLKDKILSAKTKNKSYKIYSIASQLNVYVKIDKSDEAHIEDVTKKGLLIFVFKDGSLQLFLKANQEQYTLFDGKTNNIYNKQILPNLWDGQIIILKKM